LVPASQPPPTAEPGGYDRPRSYAGWSCAAATPSRRAGRTIQARLAESLGIETPSSDRGFERFNIAPTQKVLGVVQDREGRRIEELRWGLVPHWATELNTRFSMINARAETLDQRAAYRRLVARSSTRCLILADGWYEWQRPEDPRQPKRPLHLSLAAGRLFCFAGLWTRWTSADGQVVPSCAIVTCQANELVRPIHDRMPVVFAGPEFWQGWLHPSLDSAAARELLAPLPAEEMVVRPASPVVNSARHEGPDCLAVPAAA
jgi:putative SOS response-associated peptidase YedK